MEMELVATLIFDPDLYPRRESDERHIAALKDAFEADQNIPPLVACKATRKLIDGYHRWCALIKLYGDNAKWFVKWETFASDEQRLLRAIELNAAHGRRLVEEDWKRCQVIAVKLRISTAQLASSFGVTKERFTSAVRESVKEAVNVFREPYEGVKTRKKYTYKEAKRRGAEPAALGALGLLDSQQKSEGQHHESKLQTVPLPPPALGASHAAKMLGYVETLISEVESLNPRKADHRLTGRLSYLAVVINKFFDRAEKSAL